MTDNIFGEVQVLSASGSHVPDSVQLAKELPNGVKARAFCCGCGEYYDLSLEGVYKLREMAHASEPEQELHAQKLYFEMMGCEGCDGDGSDVKLKHWK